MADHREEGKGQHHQRDMAVPAMPAARLVVSQTAFGFCRFEGIRDGPAASFHAPQRLDRGSVRTPGGEERQALIGEMTADQQPACPQAAAAGIAFRPGLEIGQFQIS